MLSTQQRITSKKTFILCYFSAARTPQPAKRHPTLSKLMVFPNNCNDIPSPSLDFQAIIKTQMNTISVSQDSSTSTSSMHPATPVVVVGGIPEDYLRP